ncbi:hypothetical protein [Haloglomus litoreum]|uniref:hypothetical protein n=1 Tax=Haloglomus litoreum TaxID=3034026 RepID=UPI0023E7E333|nr:hypothetical protein [Haloglomus sp. DT116]
MSVTGVGVDDRWAAGVAVGGLTSAYWLAAARPLVAVLVGSLLAAWLVGPSIAQRGLPDPDGPHL